MRCKNCGWNNPAGNEKCEKCNAPLAGSMIDGAVKLTFIAVPEAAFN